MVYSYIYTGVQKCTPIYIWCACKSACVTESICSFRKIILLGSWFDFGSVCNSPLSFKPNLFGKICKNKCFMIRFHNLCDIFFGLGLWEYSRHRLFALRDAIPSYIPWRFKSFVSYESRSPNHFSIPEIRFWRDHALTKPSYKWK